ncbi:MAG: hypothetical protein IJ829_06080, partial [Kiritimatiellae bacterium]|nr:hypothetical protein [Kiritimatiellia bacterium]
ALRVKVGALRSVSVVESQSRGVEVRVVVSRARVGVLRAKVGASGIRVGASRARVGVLRVRVLPNDPKGL